MRVVQYKCGDRNENFIHPGGCSLAAGRLHQQQQSTAAGENHRHRAPQLHNHGGLSGRNEAPLLACDRAARRPAGGQFGLRAFETLHPRPKLTCKDHAG